jgi:DsbC/DsbD-like thiol-disulfide interchange protein
MAAICCSRDADLQGAFLVTASALSEGMIRAVLPLLVTLAASPALAGATAWQEIASGASVRLISSDRLDGDTTLAGLELRLPASTNTYWRFPGDSGIPTTLDLSGSKGIATSTVLWPFPGIETTGGYRDFVYRGALVLPIRLKAEPGATLDVQISLGVCSDICIPARASLTLPIERGKPDAAEEVRLDQALADIPIAWEEPGEPLGGVTLTLDGKGVVIANPDSSIDPDSLIAVSGNPDVIFGAPQKSPDGALWTLEAEGGVALSGLAGQPVQFTFMTPRGPYEVTRTVAAPAQ